MKKLTFLFVLALWGLSSYAQSSVMPVRFGYLSYDSIMVSMPEYAQMQADLAQMRQYYEAEQKRVEDDFNKKYEEFLDGQASFPKTILQKRQSELQDMLDKNIAFKHESQQLLRDMEASLREGLQTMISAALVIIGQERGYAFILNTDQNAVPFINPVLGEDVTEAVKEQLQQ